MPESLPLLSLFILGPAVNVVLERIVLFFLSHGAVVAQFAHSEPRDADLLSDMKVIQSTQERTAFVDTDVISVPLSLSV